MGVPSSSEMVSPPPPSFIPTRSPILHVALEYTLPQVASNQLMYGGMGLVVDTFLQVNGGLHEVDHRV